MLSCDSATETISEHDSTVMGCNKYDSGALVQFASLRCFEGLVGLLVFASACHVCMWGRANSHRFPRQDQGHQVMQDVAVSDAKHGLEFEVVLQLSLVCRFVASQVVRGGFGECTLALESSLCWAGGPLVEFLVA